MKESLKRHLLRFLIGICLASSLHAATFTVTNTANSGAGSLRWAINQANGTGGTDTVDFDPSFFNVERTILVIGSDITIADWVIINGPGQELLTIDGNGLNRAFFVRNGSTVVNDLTIANGAGRNSVPIDSGLYAGTFQSMRGGAIYNKGTLTLNRVTIKDCQAFPSSIGTTNSRGGAIFNETTLTINDCTIADNVSLASTELTSAAGPEARGGAIYNEVEGVVVITGSSITGNKSRGFINDDISGQPWCYAYGGAIFNRGMMTLDSTTVAQNRVEAVCDYVDGIPVRGVGGGIYSIGSLTVQNECEISGNVVLIDTTDTKGIATARGGGIAGLDRILDSTISHNLVELRNDDGGDAYGGGLSGVGFVKNCRVIKNRVLVEASGEPTSRGGGLSGVQEILGCLIAENTAEVVSVFSGTARGGGIDANDGTIISNSTIAGNRCVAGGYRGSAYSGGMHLFSGTLTARNITVALNECVSTGTDWSVAYGAGLSANGGGATYDIGNSIIAGNTVSASTGALTLEADPDVSFGWGSAGFNIIGDVGGQTGFAASDQTGVAPLDVFLDSSGDGSIDLLDLQLNGGFTETLALMLAGPAKDTGSNALIPLDPDTSLPVVGDQRGPGFARVINSTVDIGAFEADLPPTAPRFTFNDRTFVNGFENQTDIGAFLGSTDPEGQPVTFSLSGTDAAFFTLDTNTGDLDFITAPDFENPQDANLDNDYWITVTASDGVNETSSSIRVTVTDVAEPPTTPVIDNTTIPENTLEVGTVSSIDQDGDRITFSINGGADQSLFAIDADTGDLSFLVAPDFENPTDANKNNVYEVQVGAASDSFFGPTNSTFLIRVTNLVEAFIFTAAVDDNFLNPANWSNITGAIATPENIAPGDPYIVDADARLAVSSSVSGSLQIRSGVTLTVEATGSLNLEAGSQTTVASGGTLSNFGSMTMDSAPRELDRPTSLTISGSAQFINQQGARFERFGAGTSTNEGSRVSGRVINHGQVVDSGVFRNPYDEWRADFINSATGNAVLRAFATDPGGVTWTNEGHMTAHVPLGGESRSEIHNSGTLTLLNGNTDTLDSIHTLNNSGTLLARELLVGLNNTGSVELIGSVTLQGSDTLDIGGTASDLVFNGATGTINQGSHGMFFEGSWGQGGPYPVQRFENRGTWTGEGRISFFGQVHLLIGNGSTLNHNGSWVFFDYEGVPQVIEIAGALSGTAALVTEPFVTLRLSGGSLASPTTAAGPVFVSGDTDLVKPFSVGRSCQINSGVTLTVESTGSLDLEGGSRTRVLSGGTLKNFGTMTMDSAPRQMIPETLLEMAGSSQFINEQGARFERFGIGSSDGSIVRGRVANHGEVVDTGSFGSSDDWQGNFYNSPTGTAQIRAIRPSDPDRTWVNEGQMTAYSPLGGKGNSVINNTGTLTLLNGNTDNLDSVHTLNNSGTLLARELLIGLNNTGSVELIGSVTLQGSDTLDLGGTASDLVFNGATGTINQGSHGMFFEGPWGQGGPYPVQRFENRGTWTGEGRISFFGQVHLLIGNGSTLTHNGSWLFLDYEGVPQVIEVAGSLTGTAALVTEPFVTLRLSGGTLASPVTSNSPVVVAADSTISGSLTLQDTEITGTGILTMTGSLSVIGSGVSKVDCPLTLNNGTGKVIEVAAGTELETNGAIVYTGGEAFIDGTWDHQQSPLSLPASSTLYGNGTLEGDVSILGTLSPGPEGGIGGLTFDGNLDLMSSSTTIVEVEGLPPEEVDHLTVTGAFTAGQNIRFDFIGTSLADPGRYEFLSASAPDTFSSPLAIGLSPIRELQYNASDPVAFVISSSGTPFQEWAVESGLEIGLNGGFLDDSNKDGIPNLIHFGHDTSPFGNGGPEGKKRLAVDLIGGTEHLTLTLPFRANAVFTGSPSPTAVIDGIRYTILGDHDLHGAKDLEVVEVSPALSEGLPELQDLDGDGTPDWEYRTFRLAADFATLSQGFLQVEISDAP